MAEFPDWDVEETISQVGLMPGSSTLIVITDRNLQPVENEYGLPLSMVLSVQKLLQPSVYKYQYGEKTRIYVFRKGGPLGHQEL